jgi:hypothetical protein
MTHLGLPTWYKVQIYNDKNDLWTPKLVTPESIQLYVKKKGNNKMTNRDLYEDEVMRVVWKRKAEASKISAEWEKNPKLYEEWKANLIAEGWKFVTPEEIAELQSKPLPAR